MLVNTRMQTISNESWVNFPPLDGELDHVTHTWSVLPAIAEVQKDILQMGSGKKYLYTSRALVHSVNNPLSSELM